MTLVKLRNAGGLHNFPALSRNFSFPSLFNDSLDRFWSDDEANWIPSVNIKERAEDYKIDLAVPGMDKKDFKVEVEHNVLTISGERKEEKLEENEKLTRREFHFGSFKRSFTLPESANSENIQATYNNGILSVTITKKEELKQKGKKEISVG